MRGAELCRNFVPPRSPVLRRESLGPESQDFYVSINDSYQAFKEGGRVESQKIILGTQEI
jgi:hypothetical protein